ncbi:MAG: 50S ribosomal protein L17 [bacterium]|nr:50S ribosomal protein L17 [bacterium]
MRHRVAGTHFSRDTKGRKALLKSLVLALIERGEMTTTKTKAKELQRVADRLIHKAQDNSVASRRTLHAFFGTRAAVNTITERIAPAMADRISGFTTMAPAGQRRGDNSEMVKISLMTKPERLGTFKSGISYAALKTEAATTATKTKKTKVTKESTKKVAPAKEAKPSKAKKVVKK